MLIVNRNGLSTVNLLCFSDDVGVNLINSLNSEDIRRRLASLCKNVTAIYVLTVNNGKLDSVRNRIFNLFACFFTCELSHTKF